MFARRRLPPARQWRQRNHLRSALRRTRERRPGRRKPDRPPASTSAKPRANAPIPLITDTADRPCCPSGAKRTPRRNDRYWSVPSALEEGAPGSDGWASLQACDRREELVEVIELVQRRCAPR